MNNEFLRPRENGCKWFNHFGAMRRRLFIERGDKTKFSHKNNRLNWFTKCLNRFRQQKDRPENMKDDMIQDIFELIQVYPDEDWFDSNFVWIDSMQVREFCETIQAKKIWCIHESIQIDVESIHMKSETLVNRFRLWGVDSNRFQMNFYTFSNDTKHQDQTI